MPNRRYAKSTCPREQHNIPRVRIIRKSKIYCRSGLQAVLVLNGNILHTSFRMECSGKYGVSVRMASRQQDTWTVLPPSSGHAS